MAIAEMSRFEQARSVVRALASEPDRKPATQIAREFLALARCDRELPRFYFTNFVYRRNAGPVHGYLSPRDRKTIRERLGMPIHPDLADKLRFYKRAGAAGLPIPRLIATIRPDGIEFDGRTWAADDADGIVAALDGARAVAASGSIFVKPHDGTSGRLCFRIDPDTEPKAVAEVAERLRGGVFLVQETLRQHPDVDRVSPTAVGCLRVHTYAQNGQPEVLSMLMRFGLGGMVVDNASNGGMFAPVDERTGRIAPPAQTHFQLGAREYHTHPASNAPLAITLPDWPRVLDLVSRAAHSFDKPFVGWDIAFTVDGPVLVEGNSTPDLMLAQIAARGLRNHPKFWPVLRPVIGTQ